MSDSSDMGLEQNAHLDWIATAREEARRARMDARTVASGSSIMRDVLTLDRESSFWNELLPRYEISDERKQGGQGVVYRGTQRGTRREVAIKVMREGPLGDVATKARFDREVQILAQLKHPNIVTILDSGVASGISYYVMDYIRGEALDTYIQQNKPTVNEILALFAKICDAVNAGHLRGIIHRDLKPSNIRVDPSGEPHILDFGLAKVNEFDALADSRTIMRTTTGQFVGSLPWASPEQVEGRPEGVDIRTDVYAIGVMLYQQLTGEFPY
ncbi:MAG: serine/threonine-protein kinase, partial [Phycisphaerae bacterium]